MKDSYKDIAKIYKQTSTKKMLLIPAIKKAIPKAKNRRLIDIGCGTGDFYPLVILKGYEYDGIDISQSMISVAKSRYANGNFLISSSVSFSNKYQYKFDVALVNLLFESFNKRPSILKTLAEIKKVLVPNGKLVLGIQNPNYDQYMRHGILGKNNVKTKFTNYFDSPVKYNLSYKFENGTASFTAWHWTLSDFVSCLFKSGFKIINIDECKPFRYIKDISEQKYANKSLYPTYLVITSIKSN